MNSTILWPDPTLPVTIHCAPGVLTGLEMVAADGLLAMPRTGLGVGGLLLGRRGSGCIYVLKSVEISCSHAMGPAFALTPAEVEVSSLWNAGEAGKDSDREVVGWYCSKTSCSNTSCPNTSCPKTHGPTVLTEHDRALFDTLCPEPWQAALLIWPRRGRETRAAFGFRESGESGSTILLGVPRELVWQELAAFEVTRPGIADTGAEPAKPPALPVDAIRETLDAQPAAVTAPVVKIPMPHTGTLFGAPEPAHKRGSARRWPCLLLVATAVLAMLSAATFLTRNYWTPRPPLAMAASSDWAGRVSILWNAEALSDVDHGSLIIAEDGDDGAGPLHTIHLDQTQVRAGVFAYDCRPGRVTATLLAGDAAESVTLNARAEPQLPVSGISK